MCWLTLLCTKNKEFGYFMHIISMINSQKTYTRLPAIAPLWTGAQPVHTHPAHMITRAVTIEDIDDLYLTWNGHINGSALYRRALREEMKLRDVDPNELRDLFERAREQGYTKDEIVDATNRYADLKALVNDTEE